MIVPTSIFSQYFLFKRSCLVEKCRDTPHCLYRDSLTIIIHLASVMKSVVVTLGIINFASENKVFPENNFLPTFPLKFFS